MMVRTRTTRVLNVSGASRFARWALLAGLASCSASVLAACSDSGSSPAQSAGAAGGSGAAGSGATDGGAAGASPETAANFGDLVEAMGGPAAKAEWTVFIYGHADHSLSYSLTQDIIEMQSATFEPGKVNVVVIADFDSSQLLPDGETHYPNGTEVYLVPGNGAAPRTIAKDVELDLDDPAQLERAVSIVFTAFPADRRAVVMWDHGGSWSGGFGHDSQNGTRTDSIGMPAQQIPPALRAGLVKAGVTAELPLDLFSFDTCLMGGAEVAYPFRGLAPTFIANAEIDYGNGWDYQATLSYIAANVGSTSQELTQAEVSQWDAHHAMSTTSDQVLRSHIGIDASKLEALASASSVLSQVILASGTFHAADLVRIAHNAAPAYSTTFEEGTSDPGLHDFGQLLDGLIAAEGVPADIVDAAKQARAALSDATIGTSLGVLREAKKQSGFHVELSSGAALNAEKLSSYAERASQWANASGWGLLLKQLDDSADQVPPELVHSVVNAANAGPDAIPQLTFSSVSSDVLQGRVMLATPGAGGALILRGIVGEGDVAPNADYQFDWDGKAVTVEGQPAALFNWLDVGDDQENSVVKIPGIIKGAGGEDTGELVFGNSDQVATYAVMVDEGNAISKTLHEIYAADPSAVFIPTLVSLDPMTGEQTAIKGQPIAIPESGELKVSLESVPAGDYVLVTQLFDVWGNQTVAQDAVVLAQAFGK